MRPAQLQNTMRIPAVWSAACMSSINGFKYTFNLQLHQQGRDMFASRGPLFISKNQFPNNETKDRSIRQDKHVHNKRTNINNAGISAFKRPM